MVTNKAASRVPTSRPSLCAIFIERSPVGARACRCSWQVADLWIRSRVWAVAGSGRQA
jgi:hypothetical protein